MDLILGFSFIQETLLLIIEMRFKLSCISVEKAIHHIHFKIDFLFLKNRIGVVTLKLIKVKLHFFISALQHALGLNFP